MPEFLSPSRASVDFGQLKFLSSLMALLCTILAGLVVIIAVVSLLNGALLAGLVQLVGGLTLSLFLFSVVRLLVEIVQGQARTQDRVTILSDRLASPTRQKA